MEFLVNGLHTGVDDLVDRARIAAADFFTHHEFGFGSDVDVQGSNSFLF
jgi:hypothetical protein